jgi:hypothetical protein
MTRDEAVLYSRRSLYKKRRREGGGRKKKRLKKKDWFIDLYGLVLRISSHRPCAWQSTQELHQKRGQNKRIKGTNLTLDDKITTGSSSHKETHQKYPDS